MVITGEFCENTVGNSRPINNLYTNNKWLKEKNLFSPFVFFFKSGDSKEWFTLPYRKGEYQWCQLKDGCRNVWSSKYGNRTCLQLKKYLCIN